MSKPLEKKYQDQTKVTEEWQQMLKPTEWLLKESRPYSLSFVTENDTRNH
jgi:hypothetical protein